MKRPIVLRHEARVEFDEAADWYEQRRSGLGGEFIDEVQTTLDRIAEMPEAYPVI